MVSMALSCIKTYKKSKFEITFEQCRVIAARLNTYTNLLPGPYMPPRRNTCAEIPRLSPKDNHSSSAANLALAVSVAGFTG